MKNLIMALAFVLVGTFASAMENESFTKPKKFNLVVYEQSIITHDFDLDAVPFDCTLTIKNNQTGDSYTITVHGKSCAELIKEIMKD